MFKSLLTFLPSTFLLFHLLLPVPPNFYNSSHRKFLGSVKSSPSKSNTAAFSHRLILRVTSTSCGPHTDYSTRLQAACIHTVAVFTFTIYSTPHLFSFLLLLLNKCNTQTKKISPQNLSHRLSSKSHPTWKRYHLFIFTIFPTLIHIHFNFSYPNFNNLNVFCFLGLFFSFP